MVSGPLGPDGGGGGDQTCTKPFLDMWGCERVWISISPPHTNRQTDRKTSVPPFSYI